MAYSPPKAWFYLKKRQSMGMGLGETVYPGRTKPDDSLAGGGNTPGAGGVVPPVGIVIPLHASVVSIGDSFTNQTSSTVGARNELNHAMGRLKGLLTPTVGFDQGKGGLTLAQIETQRLPFAILQKPDVIFVQGGRNNTFSAGTTASVIAAGQSLLNATRLGLPDAVIVWSACPIKFSEIGQPDATVLADFNIAMAAWCAADGNAINVPVPGAWNPNTTAGPTVTTLTDGTHPNVYGGELIGGAIAAAVLPFIAANDTDITQQRTAFTAAGNGFGANIDAEAPFLAANSAGTKTPAGPNPPLPTGTVPSGKNVNNVLSNGSGISVVCDNSSVPGTLSIAITGTALAENIVTFTEASGSSIATTLVLGEYYEYVGKMKITAADGVSPPVGLLSLGVSCASLGQHSNASSNGHTDNYGFREVVDWVFRTQPRVVGATGSSFSPIINWRAVPGVALDILIKITDPLVRKVERAAKFQPAYIGNDGNKASGETIRITGTLTVGSVQAACPGAWAGGAVVATAWQWKRYDASNVYVSDIIGAASGTYALTGSESGFKIGCDVTCSNGIGTPVTLSTALTAVVP